MKLDIISENLRGLNEKVGLVFFGRAEELPDAIAEIESRCPKCGGELKQEVFKTAEGEDIPEVEFCDCGYFWRYADEE